MFIFCLSALLTVTGIDGLFPGLGGSEEVMQLRSYLLSNTWYLLDAPLSHIVVDSAGEVCCLRLSMIGFDTTVNINYYQLASSVYTSHVHVEPLFLPPPCCLAAVHHYINYSIHDAVHVFWDKSSHVSLVGETRRHIHLSDVEM